MTINTTDVVTCYNSESVSDLLTAGNTYTVELVTSEGMIKLEGMGDLFFDWRFINPVPQD
ncbi:hypothetical protein [Klebsiella quasipneumoniae]|uniref:hypothetical protein n=1 Tax=Klebsiella quasipneumoniae TaxID=1463165 RepID=UPI0021698D24|nr:hypothetical protein [Klebsiella quasipneumoniae]MCS4386324.1 hypothetical protein [Klebsiella quasipneumoniae subsp. similipneumoniae]MCS4413382.1 hypothetical protein [Klebsiella quasipneumoniae subsp. similipneumoniae]